MRLSRPEYEEVLRCLDEGESLPEKYRFRLFDEARQVELTWHGKTNRVCDVVLPFQTIEQIDEPRLERQTGRQSQMLDLQTGRQQAGWQNKLIWGDNSLILSSLLHGPLREKIEEQGGLKLIYIDPPFDVGADFSMNIQIGDETLTKEPGILEEIAYRDTWGKGADSFIAMIYERLKLMRGLLADDGSIYVHCDWRVNSYMRLVLDEIFGKDNFVNEIAWEKIKSVKAQTAGFGNVKDSIYFYTKGNVQFNQQRAPHNKEYLDSMYRHTDENGRRYRLHDFTQKGQGEKRQFGDKILEPPIGKHWIWSQEKIDDGMKKGLIVFSKNGVPSVKRYLDEVQGQAISDIWDDVNPLGSISQERNDYPTQKPEALIERIIKASSNEGDLVADFFCGSGTTAAVAEKLGRKWICTDLGKFAIHTTRKRMIGVQRELKADNKDYRAFELLNLGKYERQHYIGVNPNLSRRQQDVQLRAKESEYTELILHAYSAEPVANNALFQGKRGGRMVAIGSINLPVTRSYVEDIVAECLAQGIVRVDILAFEFEMGLFDTIQEEARQQGLDLALKYIPPDVFDRRAVDKGQVVFYDVSYIEAAVHREERYGQRFVTVELTNYSVHYSQDANTVESLKVGKSKSVIRDGVVVKVTKNKDGSTTDEELTKSWKDWVDYWAVDFNYERRKEFLRMKDAETGEVAEQATGDFIFENEWQSFRTRKNRELEFTTPEHEITLPRKIAVKVVDIFGNDTMKVLQVT